MYTSCFLLYHNYNHAEFYSGARTKEEDLKVAIESSLLSKITKYLQSNPWLGLWTKITIPSHCEEASPNTAATYSTSPPASSMAARSTRPHVTFLFFPLLNMNNISSSSNSLGLPTGLSVVDAGKAARHRMGSQSGGAGVVHCVASSWNSRVGPVPPTDISTQRHSASRESPTSIRWSRGSSFSGGTTRIWTSSRSKYKNLGITHTLYYSEKKN